MAYVRHTTRLIERTKIDPRYNLSAINAFDIREYNPDIFRAIANSFKFGYAQGMKAERAAQRKAAGI